MRSPKFVLFVVAGVGCVAPEQPDSPPSSGGAPPTQMEPAEEVPCFCPVLRRTTATIEVDLACFCAELGCPSSSEGLLEPSSGTISSLECGDHISYASAASLAGASVYTFSRETGALVGGSLLADHSFYCEVGQVNAGEVLLRGNECDADWCVHSRGHDQVAEPGECLPPAYPNDMSTGGSSGLAGSGSAGPP